MIYVLLADGFEEMEALTPVDILRRAGAELKTVGVEKKEITGAHDIKVIADIELSDMKDFDMLILPGGMPGTDNLQKNPKVMEKIKYAFENNKYIGAICAAPKILGEAGYLNGKNAICFPGFEECLKGANILNQPVIKDGFIITSKGAGTASDFAFCLVEILFGKEKADSLNATMQFVK